MFKKKTNGSWSNILTIRKKIDGAWKFCNEVQKKFNGTWSIVWLSSKTLVINDPGESYGVSKRITSNGYKIGQTGYSDSSHYGKPYFDFYLHAGHTLSFDYSATAYRGTDFYDYIGYIKIEVDGKTYQIIDASSVPIKISTSATFSYTATYTKDLRFVIRMFQAELIIKNAKLIETYGNNSITHKFV